MLMRGSLRRNVSASSLWTNGRVLLLACSAFLAMTPWSDPIKTPLLALCGLLIAWTRFDVSRYRGLTTFCGAAAFTLAVNLFAARSDLKQVAVFAVAAIVPILIAHNPNGYSLLKVILALGAVLVLPDFLTNIALTTGLIERSSDDITRRAGEIITRNGGMFGHTFVSGVITMIAMAWVLSKIKRLDARGFFIIIGVGGLCLLNADLGGSRRHGLLVIVEVLVYVTARWGFARLGFLTALSLAIGVFAYEITFVGLDEGNQLRALVWAKAATTMIDNPWFGVGFGMPGTSLETFDPEDLYLTESWFLSIGVSGGVGLLIIYIFVMLKPVWDAANAYRLGMSEAAVAKFTAHLALYSALTIEFVFGGIIPSIYGAVLYASLYRALVNVEGGARSGSSKRRSSTARPATQQPLVQ